MHTTNVYVFQIETIVIFLVFRLLRSDCSLRNLYTSRCVVPSGTDVVMCVRVCSDVRFGWEIDKLIHSNQAHGSRCMDCTCIYKYVASNQQYGMRHNMCIIIIIHPLAKSTIVVSCELLHIFIIAL